MAPSAQKDRDAEEFPLHVLREYALMADGQRGALIGPRGDIAWMCAPRWDSEAVFSSLIGGGGRYAVAPRARPFVWGGYYEDGTLIWHSRWVTTSQIIECREVLAFPGDPHVAVMLRRVEAMEGDTRVEVILDPRAGFGRHKMSRISRQGGVWTDGALWPAICALLRRRISVSRPRWRAANEPHGRSRGPSRPCPGTLR